ncbi:hypothetical protein ASE75_03080 [Sphingomonas sp. Leaf17]|uniref:DUF445 domain-containing protein n=1 Tax=Sphingomonas sp. Leaf17 TaxID=1735683 RepID=UPI00071326BD|nr:DUF445 domain-containing protein [Sphingomonas sp. Leaf17]KQM68164.1 hypothetical protein ASE75_03080 [Sphingomonas sp. Leaf17]
MVRTPPTSEAPPAALVRMRMVATGLLLVMAVLFLVARAQVGIHPAWGFVRAFAEAAMVGGLADWFAVTALFRHPLGLPIPHTAIVPRNKDRIGDTLALFLRDNFLVSRVVARRMRGLDIAGAAGRWLANPPGGGGRIRAGASRLMVEMMQAFGPDRLGGMVKATIAQKLRSTEVAPILGQVLTAAIADQRHKPLLDGAIRWSAGLLRANDHLIRAMVHDRGGALLRWTGLDETVANKLIDGLDRLLSDMADDPDHPLRLKAEEGLTRLAHDLQHDPQMRERVEVAKAQLIDNPAMQRWIDGLWEQARARMLRIARDPEAAMAGKLGDMLRQFGTTLQTDARLATTINRFVRRAVVGTAADYGDGIVRLVSETVRGWDSRTITRRLENAVGRDLQYIRVNGTLVGGLVGLTIHAIDLSL